MLKLLIKELAGWVVRLFGVGVVLRTLLHRRRVAILVYHDPIPEVFVQHLAWLTRRYRFISLDTLVSALETGDWSAVPPFALVITFDDGHRGNAALADLFQRYGIHPTIYLCSQMVNTQRHFWWKEAQEHAESFKTLDHATFLKHLFETKDYQPDKAYHERQALNADELTMLEPHITAGAHTRFHPILTKCPDSLALDEIRMSRIELEQMLGHPVEHFAYPNGNYSPRELKLVKESGYRSARTIRPGWNGPGTDPYQLHAFCVEDDASLNVLSLRLSGLLIPLWTLRQGLRNLLTEKNDAV